MARLSRRAVLKGVGLGLVLGATWTRGTLRGESTMPGTSAKPQEFVLPPLAYKSLDPVIDDATLALHHDKHHAAYVAGANKALVELGKARDAGDFALVKHWERDLAFNGSGCVLHTLYWASMWPDGRGKPGNSLDDAIDAAFGSQARMLAQFAAATKAVEGSGWGVLAWEPTTTRLVILQAEKHQNLTIWGAVPILICDVWEHAYYLKYQNKRTDYVDAWMKIIDWESASARFETAVTK